jgi:hypothetical protein
MKEIQNTIIYKYINRTKLSDSRRAIYFYPGDKIPKKYTTTDFVFKEKNNKKTLFNISTNQFVIKNPKTFGTERSIPISGNKFYAGFDHSSTRIKVIESIKSDFLKYFDKLKQFKKEDYPLYIEFVYFDVFNDKHSGSGIKKKIQSQDLDNLRFAYEKCSQDLLTRMKKIVDDKLTFIRKISSEFIIVDDPEERQLYIRFFKYKPGYKFNSENKQIETI